jgi:hypothetical protein
VEKSNDEDQYDPCDPTWFTTGPTVMLTRQERVRELAYLTEVCGEDWWYKRHDLPPPTNPKQKGKRMYIGGGVIAVVLIILLLIWIF